MTEYHNIEPVFDEKSRVLILGSFPSVKSRETKFFYGHPQNRFWKVLSGVLECGIPVTIEDKKEMLLKHNIAVWDVIAECDIIGSGDSSIKNVVPNNISAILKKSNIRKIFCNGRTAFNLYKKYIEKNTELEAEYLPSTSPANAAYSLDRLKSEWQRIAVICRDI